MTIVDALKYPELFGRRPLFADLRSCRRWLVFHQASSALPMMPRSEIYVAANRRSRKSFRAGTDLDGHPAHRQNDADNVLVEPASSPR
jgi:hypothetical protein